jgi:hypothetical protein
VHSRRSALARAARVVLTMDEPPRTAG